MHVATNKRTGLGDGSGSHDCQPLGSGDGRDDRCTKIPTRFEQAMRILAKYLLIVPLLGAVCFGMLLGGGAEYVRLAAIQENNTHMLTIRLMSLSLKQLTSENI